MDKVKHKTHNSRVCLLQLIEWYRYFIINVNYYDSCEAKIDWQLSPCCQYWSKYGS